MSDLRGPSGKGVIGSIYGPRVRTRRQRIDWYHGWDFKVGKWEDLCELLIQRREWVLDKYGPDAFEDKPLMPGYSKYDLEDNEWCYDQYAVVVQPNDLKRIPLLMKQYESEHDDQHFFHLHPMCPTCRRHMAIARLSLCSWMMRSPGRIPPNPSDADLPWDIERIPVKDNVKQKDLYMNIEQLEKMKPPRDLVEGIVPRIGVGYITGRDRSLKTFLALDICLHIGSMYETWHKAPKKGEEAGARRQLRWSHYGRVIFAAGEGVSSFAPRIQAWEKAQHIRSWGDESLRTVDGKLAIRYEDCARCASETDPHVGHPYQAVIDGDEAWIEPGFGPDEKENITIKRGTVNLFQGGADYTHLLAMARRDRPDVIVLDTLALSSGTADQQAATDMGMIHDNAKRLSDACEGLVIIIAHTDKGDNDARGSSVIEDNADFVLHCTRPDNNQLEVKVAKRKDAEDNWSFIMGVEQVELDNGQSSLILTDWDGDIFETSEDPEQDFIEDVIHAMELHVVGKHKNSATTYEVQDETNPRMSRKDVTKYLGRALAQGRVQTLDRKGSATQFYFDTDWMTDRRNLGFTIADIDE